MATMPSTTTTDGVDPPRVSTLTSRGVNWPPVDAWSTQVDQASPALSSSEGSSTPTAEVAAMTASPEPTSMSGFARRVSAIFPPAMISPSTATATVSGSIHCWSWPTAGSPARSGDGTCTHQVEVWVTIQVIPDSIAAAIPLSAPRRAVPATAPATLPTTTQAGEMSTGQAISVRLPGRGRRCTRPARTARRPSCPSRRRAGRPPSSRRRPRRPPSGPRRVPWPRCAPGPALTRSRMAAAGV